jgi:methylthioribose-1-phosphate isomerase
MAASLMQKGRVDCVITGADRIAANGDVANKIGTYNLAVLCRYHKIPFYVAAPSSTFDRNCPDGDSIDIEHRSAEEITKIGGRPIAPDRVDTFSPAFDVTPHELITAIFTEREAIKS